MKRVFLIFLFLFLFIVSRNIHAFSDIEHNWYKQSILGLKQYGIINGFDDGTFKPHDRITRAEILKIIMSASKNEIFDPEESCFSDIDISSWQAKYVCSGVDVGITKGYEDATFRPNNDVTILELLAFASRAFEIDLGYLPEEKTWYGKYQAFAHEKNITPIHSYTLNSVASRAEAVNIVYRMSQVAGGEEIDFLSESCGNSPALASGEHSVTVNGNNRSYLLYVPKNISQNTSKGLIVAFHGRTNDNTMVRDYMQLGGGRHGNTKNQGDFIVVYPLGKGGGPYSWTSYENIEFFDALIAEISEKLCVDRNKIFSVGHSLGAWMSNKVSCLRGDVIRAMVAVASDGYSVECSRPVTSLILHLPNDHLVSYQGGRNAYSYKSKQNLCDDTEESISIGSIKGCSQKRSCSLGNSVTFCNSYTPYWGDPHSWPRDGGDDILDFLRSFE